MSGMGGKRTLAAEQVVGAKRMLVVHWLTTFEEPEQMKVPSIQFILLIIGAWIASSLLAGFGTSRDLSAAVFLTLFFVGWLIYRGFVQKERLGGTELLLAAPVCLVLVLVSLNESGVLGLPRGVIWIAFVIVSILALGYASPSDDRTDTAP